MADARVVAIRTALEGARSALRETFNAGTCGVELGRQRAAHLDQLLSDLYRDVEASVPEAVRAGLCLAGVGSFGRGAVAFNSDADVRLLVQPRSKAKEAQEKFSEALFYPLWDAGLTLGHQVVDASQLILLAQDDLATATSLLDLRPVAGTRDICAAVKDRAASGLFSEGELGKFVDRLEAEGGARHAKFGGSMYLLEPDVKFGAGGLRDLDGVRWAARARFAVSNEGGIHGTWAELVRLGALVAREAHELGSAEEFLWRVRNHLHARAGRRNDRLSFDDQEHIATTLGYGGDRHEAAEHFMQEYYLHARVITRARERLLERVRPPRRRGKPSEADLGEGVRMFDGQVTVESTGALADDPALALRVYDACARHGAPVLPFAREAIARQAAVHHWCVRLRASPQAARIFNELVCRVPDAKTKSGSMMNELHDVGLLLAMIPEFLPVTGRVHHDVYHVYTVDVHSVAALDYLRALCRGELAAEHPLASRLAAEIAHPRSLFLATLLHDVGKGFPDANGSRKDHSRVGADLAAVILGRLGATDAEVAEVRMLIDSHLSMYHTATRRDLDDPVTITEFCDLVSDEEGLRNLYLLTVADITTTSPQAMTSWKARMLDDLYVQCHGRFLGSGRFVHDGLALRVKSACKPLWPDGGDALDAFVDSMPERYLASNAPEEVAQHAKAAIARKGSVSVAMVRPTSSHDFVQLCVVADDVSGFLANVAGALTANRLEVLAAQVYSRDVAGTREAVDLFWVRDRAEGAEGVARVFPRLIRDIESICAGTATPEGLIASRIGQSSPWRERPSPQIETGVVVDGRASQRHTVVEVVAKDRVGLLFDVARGLSDLGLNIELSKINTEGTKAVDIFYVLERDGSRVEPGARYREIRDTLLGILAVSTVESQAKQVAK
jgi:[protein-PII] uridylyltransferase